MAVDLGSTFKEIVEAINQKAEQGNQGEIGYGFVASVSRTGKTEQWWSTYSEIGHIENWSNTENIRNNCRVGDLFLIVGTSDEGRAHMLIYRSTTSSGALKGECIASFVADRGEKGLAGDDGRGVSNIKRTSGNGSAGSTDTYTITYTDNSTSTFTVYNGKDGAAGATPVIEVEAGSQIGTVGTPMVSSKTSNGVTTFTFNYLKGEKGDAADTSKFVTIDTEQNITGFKTFKSPTNKANTEQASIWFETANGGRVGFGKEKANSGTGIFFDQVKGTRRLNFRASSTVGAMVWEQPEQGAQLYFDIGKEGVDKKRISLPSKAGTLALTSDIKDTRITFSVNKKAIGDLTLNQSDPESFDITVPTSVTELDGMTTEEVNTALDLKADVAGEDFMGKITAPQIETGTADSNYFQSRKFRGEGNADTYYHAIDFGYSNNNKFEFHEYGGTYNFYKNENGKKDTGVLVGAFTPSGIKEGDKLLSEKYAAKTDIGKGTVTVVANGDNSNSFSVNSSENVTISVPVPTTPDEVGADPAGSASEALTTAKSYTDGKLTEANNYTDTKISELIGGAPETLDTLKEISEVIGDNENAITALNAAIANKADKTLLDNYVTLGTGQTITGSKIFQGGHKFTGETQFTNSSYTPEFKDIAAGIGKSSCFTRGAHMQVITGQILAPNQNYTDGSRGYNTQINTIKFQKMTASNGQPVVTDMGLIDEKGFKEGTLYLSEKYAPKGDYALKSDVVTPKNGVLTIKVNSNKVADFGADSSSSIEANITVPTKTSELTNDSNFLTSHQDISGKLDKTTYEFNKELALGSNGKVCLGKFSMYDTNLTIEISSTTSQTYSGKLVLATQNIDNAHGGSYSANVYGDATGTLSDALTIIYPTNSRIFEIYCNFTGWSKNLIHIQAVNLQAQPTNVVVVQETDIPTANKIPINNVLRDTFAKKDEVVDVSGKANIEGGNTFKGTQVLQTPTSGGYSIQADGYIKGSLLQAPLTGHENESSTKVAILDGSGWIYYRTPKEIVEDSGNYIIPTNIANSSIESKQLAAITVGNERYHIRSDKISPTFKLSQDEGTLTADESSFIDTVPYEIRITRTAESNPYIAYLCGFDSWDDGGLGYTSIDYVAFNPSTNDIHFMTFNGQEGEYTYAASTFRIDNSSANKANLTGGNTFSGKQIFNDIIQLKAGSPNIGSNGIRWDANSLPQDSAPKYICTIDAFANGGRQKWATIENLRNNLSIPSKVTDLSDNGNYVTTDRLAGSSAGLVKSGGNVTISNGVITVSDNGHNHTIANVNNLQSSLDNKTNTSVMPNDGGDIKTKFRMSHKGYTSGEQWYFPICKFPTDDAGNYASAIVSGRIGGWQSSNLSYINALVWNRDSTDIALMDIAGSASTMKPIWDRADLVIYDNSDNSSTLYVKCNNYYTFDLDLELYQSGATILYDGSYINTTPSGTLMAQSSQSTKRVEIVNGKVLVNGTEMAKKSDIPNIVIDDKFVANSTNPVQSKVVQQGIADTLSTAKTYTETKIAELVGTAPETLDTLQEVAKAIQDNENTVEALNEAIGKKVDKTTYDSGIAGKLSKTENTGVSVLGTSKNTTTIGQYQLYAPKGVIFGGSALEAGLVTRGISGISTPSNGGACNKDNLYINYDGDNNFNAARQVVVNAGSAGNHLGSNMYQYTLPRGEIVKNWVESQGYLKSHQDISGKLTGTKYSTNADFNTYIPYSNSKNNSAPQYVATFVNNNDKYGLTWSSVANLKTSLSLSTVATSGSYNDLSDKPTITKGTVTQVKINGTTKSPDSNGLVDLGTVGGGGSSGKYLHAITLYWEEVTNYNQSYGTVTFNIVNTTSSVYQSAGWAVAALGTIVTPASGTMHTKYIAGDDQNDDIDEQTLWISGINTSYILGISSTGNVTSLPINDSYYNCVNSSRMYKYETVEAL